MLEALNNGVLYFMDLVMGWSLSLPRDAVLLIVAMLTGLILTVVRLFTTDQEWLKRCKRDKSRLGELIRQAKKARDKEAVSRYKNTIQEIGLKSFKSEGLPLLVSLIPIACLATWAMARLAYLAPEPGKPVTVTLDFPADARWSLVSLVPQEGMTCEGGWTRQIKGQTQRFDSMGRLPAPIWPILHREDADPNNVPASTVDRATWKITCQKSAAPYPLEFRFHGETLEHKLITDGRKYSPPVSAWGGGAINLRMDLPEYKFLGFLPSIDLYWNKGVFLPLDSWILGYLIIVIPLSLILKPILRVA